MDGTKKRKLIKKNHGVLGGKKHNAHESSNLPLRQQPQRRQFFIINGRVTWTQRGRGESSVSGELKAWRATLRETVWCSTSTRQNISLFLKADLFFFFFLNVYVSRKNGGATSRPLNLCSHALHYNTSDMWPRRHFYALEVFYGTFYAPPSPLQVM